MRWSFPIKVLLCCVGVFFVYSYFVYTQDMETKQARKDISDEAVLGKDVFQKYNCVACHQVFGLGGYLGPDLTNTISLKGEKYAETFLRNGSSVMPNFHLKEEEISHLLEFLKAIDASGVYAVKEYEVNWTGTVETKETNETK